MLGSSTSTYFTLTTVLVALRVLAAADPSAAAATLTPALLASSLSSSTTSPDLGQGDDATTSTKTTSNDDVLLFTNQEGRFPELRAKILTSNQDQSQNQNQDHYGPESQSSSSSSSSSETRRRMARRNAEVEGGDGRYYDGPGHLGMSAYVGQDGGIHLPLVRTVRRDARSKRSRIRRNAETGAIGLGSAQDVTYNVLVKIGNTTTPLVLDTGSSDLWVLSTACTTCFSHITDNRNHPPLYPIPPISPTTPFSSFTSTNLSTTLHYGDTLTGTYSHGILGSDTVSVASLALHEQYFAAVGETNTSVVDTGSAGILGLGFPVNSVVWNKLYSVHLNETAAAAGSNISATARRSLADNISAHRRLPTLPPSHLVSNTFTSKFTSSNTTGSKAAPNNTASPIPILSSFSLFGSVLPRFLLPSPNGGKNPHPCFSSPLISITVQRTTPSSAFSNTGLLTLGALPPGVSNASLAWAPVRLYDHGAQGGLRAAEAPEERYPFAWEVGVEGVWFDGVRLPESRLGDAGVDGVGVSALVDTGNSLIRGPADIVRTIISMLAASSPAANPGSDPTSSNNEDRASAILANSDTRAAQARGLYPCTNAHTLTFQIAGRNFSVDPRDFGTQAYVDNVEWCVPNLVATDAPKVGGYLYSWSLGDPFLKGILAAFYYGNITHPSVDPPKIGLLSTVPDNAAELLSSAVEAAENSEGGNFPVTTIEAPTGTWAPFTTNKDGVGMFGGAGETGAPGMGGVGGKDGANSGSSIVGEVALRMGWTMLVWVVGVVCTLVW